MALAQPASANPIIAICIITTKGHGQERSNCMHRTDKSQQHALHRFCDNMQTVLLNTKVSNVSLTAQGIEHNSDEALYAVSQGRGWSAGCVGLTAAQTIAAQCCLRKPACSKALGHAGFCDSARAGPGSALRPNSLAGLAAAAEQAYNGSTGNKVSI